MTLPPDIVLIVLIAMFAQLVNGSMGMGYGVITSSLLLAMGMAPAQTSATVHLAQIGTTTTSGAAHWRLKNVDWRLTGILALPGAAGGFAGALLLTSIPVGAARPFISIILLALGALIFVRFILRHVPALPTTGASRPRFLAPLGGLGGFLDASGGGGWGPVTMGTLMARPPAKPRIVVGSVNASEVAVTIAASAGFLLALGWSGMPLAEILALMIGGMITAPFAALLARRLPARYTGGAVAMLLLVLNARYLGSSLDIGAVPVVAGVLAVAGALYVAAAWRRNRQPAQMVSIRVQDEQA